MGNLTKWLCLVMLPIVFAQDYCSICADHTMCKFKGKGPTCGANSQSGVSKAEAKQIVDLHNAFRAQIANGQESRGRPGPQPPAANMRALVWDDQLAEVAQRWADQCTFQHDQCRNDPRFKVGQNIYWSSGFSTVNWTRAVGSWYNEVKDFNGQSVNNFRLNRDTGHYTQLAWATTTLIGCARTTYGGGYRMQGYRPREFVLAASPSKPKTSREEKSNHRVKKQSDLGFFGGATFDPSGAHGAITSSSGGASGSNRPSRPPMGNFPDIGNEDIDAGNSPNRPNFPIFGNRPNYPGAGYRPTYPNHPSYPNYPFLPQYFGQASNNAYYYPGSNGYYSGGYYQQAGAQYPVYIPADYAPYFTGYGENAGFPNPLGGLGFFDGEAEAGLPSRPIETKPAQLHLPTYTEWEKEQINGKPSMDTVQNEPISSHVWSGNEWVPTNYDFVGRDQILICNYGPAGNYFGEPIYIEGSACSKCPQGTACQNGLCVLG